MAQTAGTSVDQLFSNFLRDLQDVFQLFGGSSGGSTVVSAVGPGITHALYYFVAGGATTSWKSDGNYRIRALLTSGVSPSVVVSMNNTNASVAQNLPTRAEKDTILLCTVTAGVFSELNFPIRQGQSVFVMNGSANPAYVNVCIEESL